MNPATPKTLLLPSQLRKAVFGGPASMRLTNFIFATWILLVLPLNSAVAGGPPDAAAISYSLVAKHYPRAERKENPPNSQAEIDRALQDYNCEYLTQLVAFLRDMVKTSLAQVNSRKTFFSGTYVVWIIGFSDFDDLIDKDEKGRFSKINKSKDYDKWMAGGFLDIPTGYKEDFFGYERASKVVKESYQKIIQMGIERCEQERSPGKATKPPKGSSPPN